MITVCIYGDSWVLVTTSNRLGQHYITVIAKLSLMEKAPRPWIKSRCDKGLLWRVNNQGDYIRGYCEFIGNKHTRVHLQKQTYTNQMMGSKQYYHAVSGSRKKCPSFLRNNHCASDNLLMFYSLFRCTRADLLKLLPVWYRTRLHI